MTLRKVIMWTCGRINGPKLLEDAAIESCWTTAALHISPSKTLSFYEVSRDRTKKTTIY